MHRFDQSSDSYHNITVDAFLQDQIADFTSYSDSMQQLLFSVVSYFDLASQADLSNLPFDVNISISSPVERESMDIELSALSDQSNSYCFTALNIVLPEDSVLSYEWEGVIKQLAKKFSAVGKPVINASVLRCSNISSPVVVSVDLSSPLNFSFSDTDYKVLAVRQSSLSTTLGKYDLLKRTYSVVGKTDVLITQQSFTAGVGWLVKLACDNRFGFRLNLTDLSKNSGEPLIFLVFPVSFVESMMKEFHRVGITDCGDITFYNKNGSIKLNSETVGVSTLVLDNMIIESARRRLHLDGSILIPNESESKYFETESSLVHRDISENTEFSSSILLEGQFDSTINTFGANFCPTPFGTYVKVRGVGRLFVSLKTYLLDKVAKFNSNEIFRSLFEHNAFSGNPKYLRAKILFTPDMESDAKMVAAEMNRIHDLFSVVCSVELVSSQELCTGMLVSMALVSTIEGPLLNQLDGFKEEFDLLYALNYDFSEASSSIVGLKHTGLLISHEEIRHLIAKGLLNCICPISSGGVMGALFLMGQRSGFGFDITSFDELDRNIFLNAPTIGHVVVGVPKDKESQFVDYMLDRKIPTTILGHITSGEIIIDEENFGTIVDLKKKVSFAFQNSLKNMSSKKQVTPYAQPNVSKKEQVANMFDNIAHKYDFLNHFLSMGIDKLWRRRLVKEIGKYTPNTILDVATGTGDLAIALSALKPASIVGIDIAVKMVEVGIEKVRAKGLDGMIVLTPGDSENINFENETFDAATVAFGVRNFENPLKGLSELNRVLRPGGVLAVLEFSMPSKFPIKQLYKFYFFSILPFIGRFFSKDNSAYTYLPESVEAFPYGTRFTELMKQAGFSKTRIIPLSFGIANIYIGEK